MILPSDPPTPAAPSANLIDTAPLIDPAQREKDFHRVFAWKKRELKITVINETYYRELRAHMNAPRLDAYKTKGDFAPEAARVLYCSALSAAEIALLRRCSEQDQIAAHDQWVAQNITLADLDDAADLAEKMQQCVHRARAHSTTGETVDGAGNLPCRQ
jgi:hypothetical protein